ncbi:MAG TPA: AsnC family protein [Candidatus Acidoferrales bacterium]|nr:AsnC family protein [Candidatus Acidoferrales bacterium]
MNHKAVLGNAKKVMLLRLLEENPRASISELARRIGMSVPAVKEGILD